LYLFCLLVCFRFLFFYCIYLFAPTIQFDLLIKYGLHFTFNLTVSIVWSRFLSKVDIFYTYFGLILDSLSSEP